MTTTINLYGGVGWDITAKSVVDSFAVMKGDVDIHLNSPGGDATEALSIYNTIANYEGGKTTLFIDGVAMSAATVIMLGADEVIAHESAIIMIHEASTLAWGRKTDLDKTSQAVETVNAQYAKIYAHHSGKSIEAVRVTMDEEPWMSADEAKEYGLINSVKQFDTAENINTLYQGFDIAACPEWAVSMAKKRVALGTQRKTVVRADPTAHLPAINNEDINMSENTNTGAGNTVPDNTIVAEAAGVTANKEAEIKASAASAERGRLAKINAAGLKLKVSQEKINEIAASDSTLEEAQEQLMDAFASSTATAAVITNASVDITADGKDKLHEGISKAILARAGRKDGERNEFTGMSLIRMGEEVLKAQGIHLESHDPRDSSRQILAHSTSDFPLLLKSTADRVLGAEWKEREETYGEWTSKGSYKDFRATQMVNAGLFPTLEPKQEGGNYKMATMSENGNSMLIGTSGRIINFTREAIINDDLNIFSRLIPQMVIATGRTVGDGVIAVLTANQALPDGKALFHADHKNLLTGGTSALDVSSLKKMRTKMRLQKDADEIATALNLQPRFIIVPAALEDTAVSLMGNSIDPSQSNPAIKNPVANMAKVIVDARLDAVSSTGFYLATDPSQYQTVEIGYLNGDDSPYIDVEEDWNTDGTKWKVRLDWGVSIVDYRGLAKSAGA